jgi:nucleotide-sensitive chloride channel 1A
VCASLHPDPEDDMDDSDAFIDADPNDLEIFTGAEGEELSEVGRVRSDPQSNARFAPY